MTLGAAVVGKHRKYISVHFSCHLTNIWVFVGYHWSERVCVYELEMRALSLESKS